MANHLLKVVHSGNLVVNLLGIFLVEISRDGDDRTEGIGTTSFVPIGTRSTELSRSHDVDTAVFTKKQILASQIGKTRHHTQGLKMLFVAAVSITTPSPFGIAIVVIIARINAGHTNAFGNFSPVVVPKTFGWTSQHIRTIPVFSTQFQRPFFAGHFGLFFPRIAKILETGITIQFLFVTVRIRDAHWVRFGIVNGNYR